MLKSFTRNYHDNSTEAGFQFTFYCDICNDGFKSSFDAKLITFFMKFFQILLVWFI